MSRILLLLLLALLFSHDADARRQIYLHMGCSAAELETKRPCPDEQLYSKQGTNLVWAMFTRDNFKGLDETFDSWSKGQERFPDGRWKLTAYTHGFIIHIQSWKTWDETYQRIKKWQEARPDSFAAKYVEAVYWRSYGWHARGSSAGGGVAPESWQLFKERLGKAEKILAELRPRAKNYPAWYETAIYNKIELGDSKAAGELFLEGQALFPEYHKLYFAMSKALNPKWGGSAEMFEKFARSAASKTAAFEGEGMYLRIYQTVDSEYALPFAPESSKTPDWQMLKKGINSLMKKYPSSASNLNHFASLACRAKDKDLYLQLRTAIGTYWDVDKFSSPTLEACDLRFGFKDKK